MRKLTALILVLFGLVVASAYAPWPRPLLGERGPAPRPADIKAWGLQLQNVLPLAIPAPVDVMVVDSGRDTTDGRGWTKARVESLRRRDAGPRRIVLAYLSIGEAENYRHYWHPSWTTSPPAWLGRENQAWKGNFAVRYWHPEWQSLIVARDPTMLSRLLDRLLPERKPFIDRILEAGFDGVYLDRVDAFDDWAAERGEERAEADMAAFVRDIASYARSRRPGFLIVPQNGEELIAKPGYVDLIDAVAKEDLLFGIGGDGTANEPDTVAATAVHLDRALAKGKPVLVVEYLPDDGRRAEAARAIAARGYVPLFADRPLKRPPELPPTLSAPADAPPAAQPRPAR